MTCDICNQRPSVITLTLPKDGVLVRQEVCGSCQQNITRSGFVGNPKSVVGDLFGDLYAEATFDTFKGAESMDFFQSVNAKSSDVRYTHYHMQALSDVREEVRRFVAGSIRTRKGRLFVTGKPGHGKTHLAAAATHEYVRAGMTVAVLSLYEFVSDMLDTHNQKMARERTTQRSIISRLGSYDVVVIDDFNLDIITESTPRYVGWLLSELVKNNTILIVLSQFQLKTLQQETIKGRPGMGESVMDRFIEPPSQVVVFDRTIPSFRYAKALLQ